MPRALLTLALIVAGFFGFIPPAYPVLPPGLQAGTVTNVVDGDTIDVQLAGNIERLRLIGMDTPETKDPRTPVQCFGREASARAAVLLGGKTVQIETDASQDTRDRYGRLLAYVWVGGNLYNLDMITDGYAHEYTYDVAYTYQAEFKQAEAEAAAADRGFWSPATCNGDTEQAALATLFRIYLPVVRRDPEPTPTPTIIPTATATTGPPSPPPTDVPPPPPATPTSPRAGCDAAYPTVCIPSPPPDLDCGDIPYRRFTVLAPDPHRFDSDNDGIGCESG